MYEGKEIIFKHGGEETPAVVVSAVRGIGISIVDKNNKDSYLWCLRMKNAPNFYPGIGEITYTNKLYSEGIKRIRSGFLDMDEIDSLGLKGRIGGGASSSSCAFGQ